MTQCSRQTLTEDLHPKETVQSRLWNILGEPILDPTKSVSVMKETLEWTILEERR